MSLAAGLVIFNCSSLIEKELLPCVVSFVNYSLSSFLNNDDTVLLVQGHVQSCVASLCDTLACEKVDYTSTIP